MRAVETAPSGGNPPAQLTAEHLSVSQAAQYLGLSEAYLNRLRSIGGSPAFYKIGTRVTYRRSDLDTWLEPKRRTSTSDAGQAA